MNEYLKKAMEKAESKLPQTFEEFGKMHPADANYVPISHVQKLRKDYDNKIRGEKEGKGFNPINFD